MESDSEISKAAMKAEDAFRKLTRVLIVVLVIAVIEGAVIGWLLGVLADGHHAEQAGEHRTSNAELRTLNR